MTDRGWDIDSGKLVALAGELEQRVAGREDVVAIGIGTDLVEAFYIGTRHAYLRLAACLLRTAAFSGEQQSIAGIACIWTEFTYDATASSPMISVRGEFTVESALDRELLERYLRRR